METTQSTVLDCGHVNDWGSPGTGCHTPEGKSLCTACAFEREREAFRKAETVFSAYLSTDALHVTAWGGGSLALVFGGKHQERRTPSGGRYTRFTARAVDEWGRTWSVIGQGGNMLCTLRRVKG